MKLAVVAFASLLAGCVGPKVAHPAAAAPADAGAAVAEPTLVPTGLEADFLPINSVRGEIVGHDAAADLCVRVIWDFSNHGKDPYAQHCNDFFEGFPYVALTRGQPEHSPMPVMPPSV